jgi:Hint domain
MAQSTGWNIHRVGSNDRTVGSTTPNTTISTDSTGAGPSLQAGETFQIGTTTYTYGGTATAGTVGGFYATSGGNTFFFSKAVATNTPVTRATGDTPVCFYPGTLVRTPDGDAAVETLKAGDLVLTADGRAAPVRWLGRQTVSTRFADPLRVLPIRVAAGALGENLPRRDLLLSPDHALLVDGVLIQAGALVNGTTIRRERDVPEVFTYWHVELADHALLLAEDVPAETFVDNVDRLAFDNWDEHETAGSEAPIAEMALPRAKSARQVPAATRRRLAARAAAVSGAAMVAA